MSKFEAYQPKGNTGEINATRRVGKQGAIVAITAGTNILTVKGQRPVEQLVPGDRVLTRDHGLQEIRWIGNRHVDASDVEFDALRPVRIAAGALGNGMPAADLVVAPNHRVLVAGDAASLTGEDDVLMQAKDLIGRDGVAYDDAEGVIVFHIMFDAREVVMAEGTWTDANLPGETTLDAISAAAAEELFAIYPELRVLPTPMKPAMDPVIAAMLNADAGLEVETA